METIKGKSFELFSVMLLSAALLFYLFFAFFDGYVICVDSPTYIYMESSREPLYPSMLALFRWLTGESQEGTAYLQITVVVQSLLAAFSAWAMAVYLRKEYDLGKLLTTAVFAMPLAVSVLCRFAAGRGSMYSNSILTEGVAISLYFLFFRFVLEYCLHDNKRCLLISAVLCTLLILTRKQMYLALFMLCFCVLYVNIRECRIATGCKVLLLLLIVILGCNRILDMGYNYLVRGEAVTHTSDVRFISTIAFYTAEREDAERIQDPEIRELFYEIYDRCEEQGYLRHSAGKGWRNRDGHFDNYYDCIQIDTMWPAVNAFVKKQYEGSDAQISVHADEVMKTISKSVIPHNLLRVMTVFTDNIFSGLIVTIAQKRTVLIWYSLFMYLLYIGMTVRCIAIKKDRKLAVFSVMTLLSILINVGTVSVVIFCQSRYMVYNMALFYISVLMMIDRLVLKKYKMG